MKHQLDEAQATLSVPETAPIIVTDRLALEQVVGNVVDNAVKYLARDRPGRISIAVSQAPASGSVPAFSVSNDAAANGINLADLYLDAATGGDGVLVSFVQT